MKAKLSKTILAALTANFVALAYPAPAHAATGCMPIRLFAYDMTYDWLGRPTVPVSLDGRERYLLIDTGGAYSTLDHGPTEEWGLTPQDSGTYITGVTGARSSDYVEIGDFRIGTIRSGAHPFMITPGMNSVDSEVRTIGTLGPDILHGFDVEFDFGAGRWSLFRHSPCGTETAYWDPERLTVISFTMDQSGHVTFPVTVDGAIFNAIIDTGAATSIINQGLAVERLGIDLANEVLEHIGTIGDAFQDVYRHTFGQIVLNDLVIDAPELSLLPDLMISDLDRTVGTDIASGLPDIIIGMDIMSRLRLYIAYDEMLLYVSDAVPAE